MEKYHNGDALLVGQSGPLNGQRWPMRATLLIGRDAECDIVIPDRQVSRHHVQLIESAQGVFLKDLGSKNGTHLNGRLVESASLLQDGDLIQVALAQKFVFLSSDATLPLDSPFVNIEQAALTDSAVSDFSTHVEGEKRIPVHKRMFLDNKSHRVWIRVKERPLQPASKRQKKSYHELEIDPPLSASQFRLLEILYEQEGEVISRADLVASVWGEEQAIGVSEQALDALIRRLRDRLAGIEPAHTFIITVRGHGLRLDNPLIEE